MRVGGSQAGVVVGNIGNEDNVDAEQMCTFCLQTIVVVFLFFFKPTKISVN